MSMIKSGGIRASRFLKPLLIRGHWLQRGAGASKRRYVRGDRDINHWEAGTGQFRNFLFPRRRHGGRDVGCSAGRHVDEHRKVFFQRIRIGVCCLILLWMAWLFWSSASFINCIQQRENAQTYRGISKDAFFASNALLWMKLCSVCTVHVANDFQGAIAGCAGIAVAYFTFTLYRATERLWRAGDEQLSAFKQSLIESKAASTEQNRLMSLQIDEAKVAAEAAVLSAKAAIGVELPRFELDAVRLTMPHTPLEDCLWVGGVEIELRNHGRTTAHIVEDCVVAVIATELMSKPRYPLHSAKDAPLGSAIRAGETYKVVCNDRMFVAKPFVADVLAQQSNLWLFGYVAYKDFLGGHWRSKFCLIFNTVPGMPGFVDPKTYPAYSGSDRYDPNSMAEG